MLQCPQSPPGPTSLRPPSYAGSEDESNGSSSSSRTPRWIYLLNQKWWHHWVRISSSWFLLPCVQFSKGALSSAPLISHHHISQRIVLKIIIIIIPVCHGTPSPQDFPHQPFPQRGNCKRWRKNLRWKKLFSHGRESERGENQQKFNFHDHQVEVLHLTEPGRELVGTKYQIDI